MGARKVGMYMGIAITGLASFGFFVALMVLITKDPKVEMVEKDKKQQCQLVKPDHSMKVLSVLMLIIFVLLTTILFMRARSP